MAGALVLGAVTFLDFEIPEKLVIGGKQQLIIHSLPGGRRVVDAMGPQDAPVLWRGIFSGHQAAERVRLLELMRRDGRPYTLTFDAWRYDVVVEEFEAEIASNSWIPYRIRLCILDTGVSAGEDWLMRAQAPTLTIGLQAASTIEGAINVASAGLRVSDVGQAIGAAGNLAQLVTARLFGLSAP